jgi:outer membrane immunogenic protein
MRIALRLFALAGAIVTSSAAFAADRPVLKAPRYVAPAYNWTGFYVGTHGGASWARNNFFDVLGGADAAAFTANGYFGGGQAGYNWQIGQWVLGAEIEGSWSHLQKGVCAGLIARLISIAGLGGGTSPCNPQNPQQSQFGGLGGTGCPPGTVPNPSAPQICLVSSPCAGFGGGCSAGARVYKIGLLSTRLGFSLNRYLFYVKGGGAVAEALYVINVPGVVSVQPSDTRFGWMVGGGVEWAVLGNWSIKAEYNFIDFGTVRLAETGAGGTVVLDHSQQVHLAKGGINYRF